MLDSLIRVYFAVWVVMGIGTILFFWGRSPAFKRKWHRPVTAVNGIVIGGFLVVLTFAMETPWPSALFFLAALAYIFYGSSKIRVCGACGKTVQPQGWLTAPKFCPRCGASLTEDVENTEPAEKARKGAPEKVPEKGR